MNKDEALRLALEALELVSNEFVCNNAHHAKKDRHEWLDPCPIVDRYKEAITAIKAALEAKDGCQCLACKVAPHASDCAVHSEPAYPAGECNCGASGEPVAWSITYHGSHCNNIQSNKELAEAELKRLDEEHGFAGRTLVPLYSAQPKQPPVIDKSVARRIATQLGWEPPRTPLPDEEIRQANHHMVCGAYDYSFKQGVRWAEKVHGIKWEWEK
mgnify:FL=1